MAFFARPGQSPKFSLGSRPRLKLAQLTSVKPFTCDFNEALKEHDGFRKEIFSNPNVYEVRVQRDLNRITGIGALLGLQRAPDHMAFADVCMLRERGVKFMSLAYSSATEYGGGFLSEGNDDRLTIRGKKLIEWMAEAGITLDFSHTGHVTMFEAMNYIQQKNLPIWVVATHSGCYSVCPHPRNVPDDILKTIDHLGVPGISFYIGPKGSNPMENCARHLEYAINATGKEKHKVGIGSDCPHVSMTMEQAEAEFTRMREMLKTGGTFGEYFPDRPPELIQHGDAMFPVIEHSPWMEPVLKLDPGVLGLNFKNFLAHSLPPV